MPAKAKVPKGEPVGIGVKLRKAYPWFETLAQKPKDTAISNRRKLERANGPQLGGDELTALSDELEEIQRQLNPLENRRAQIVKDLLAHWGHTGIEEIEGRLGATLISTSFELALDPDEVKKTVGEALWQKITARVLQAPSFLREGEKMMVVRDAAEKSLRVRKLRISVTAPSSRGAKSGESSFEEERENVAA
jgi:hypothetical protein